MSGPDRKTPDDEMLARYVDGQSDVSRAYRQASAAQPPAELDRRILELARAELASASAPRNPQQRRGNRWRTSLAAAAVVVLSVGVLINLQRENAWQPAVPAAAPDVSTQRQPQAAKEIERAPEQEASEDAVAERPAVEARAAGAPPDAATSVTVAPPPAPAAAPAPAPAEAPLLQQKAERDAVQKGRSERESARKRFAADAPAAMMRPQAAVAGGAGLATPVQEAWSCQAADAQWERIRRLFAERQPEQARAAYRELESACPDIEVPEDLRDRFDEEPKADSPE